MTKACVTSTNIAIVNTEWPEIQNIDHDFLLKNKQVWSKFSPLSGQFTLTEYHTHSS